MVPTYIPRARLEAARAKVMSVFAQRCFYLFCALVLLLISVPFLEGSPDGRLALNAINIVILLMGAVAVSHSPACFALAILLGVPALGCQVLSIMMDEPLLRLLSRAFGGAFYFMTLSYLMQYVLRREVLTLDKLYGAAAAFLMLGILWSYFYFITLHFYPGAFTAAGQPVTEPTLSGLAYFSFTVLTTTGFGDVLPAHPVARMVVTLEQIVGVLYIAILIARLASSYHPVERR